MFAIVLIANTNQNTDKNTVEANKQPYQDQEKLATMVNANHQQIVFSAFVKPAADTQQIHQGQFIQPKSDLLQPLRNWLDSLEIQNRKFAKLIAKVIPAQCPFERDIMLFNRKIAHIPPMCKLNPLYDQFVGLRFRALCYLVDKCGEDIQSYC